MFQFNQFTAILVLLLSLTACGTVTETDNTANPTDPADTTDTTDPTETDASDTTEPVDSVLVEPLLVRGVMDGDTFEVLRNGEVFRIRMKGIDTPELSGSNDQPEPCAEDAKQFLWDTIGNSEVGLEFDSSCGDDPYDSCYDSYDRLLAYVRLHNGDDLATLILNQGLGRVYRFNNESFDRLAAYNSAEQSAQNDDLGIWANSGQQCR